MSRPTSTLHAIAERYAVALFDLANADNALDPVEHDLTRIERMVVSNKDVQRLIRSPVLSRNEQCRAMGALLNKLAVHPLTGKFAGLLAAKRRLFSLPQIIREFRRLCAAKRGEMHAEVVSAQPLKEAQITALKGALKDVYKRDVRLDARIDPNLIGGFVLQAGSRQIDYSLRAKLKALELKMKGAA